MGEASQVSSFSYDHQAIAGPIPGIVMRRRPLASPAKTDAATGDGVAQTTQLQVLFEHQTEHGDGGTVELRRYADRALCGRLEISANSAVSLTLRPISFQACSVN